MRRLKSQAFLSFGDKHIESLETYTSRGQKSQVISPSATKGLLLAALEVHIKHHLISLWNATIGVA